MTDRHGCPACDTDLVSEPISVPLRCKHCGWHLVSLDAWRKLPPFGQGYTFYMEGDWPTSELAGEKNPYEEGTPAWTEFRHGEQRATLDAQDGEE